MIAATKPAPAPDLTLAARCLVCEINESSALLGSLLPCVADIKPAEQLEFLHRLTGAARRLHAASSWLCRRADAADEEARRL
jgi:hypothetical protein